MYLLVNTIFKHLISIQHITGEEEVRRRSVLLLLVMQRNRMYLIGSIYVRSLMGLSFACNIYHKLLCKRKAGWVPAAEMSLRSLYSELLFEMFLGGGEEPRRFEANHVPTKREDKGLSVNGWS